MRRLRERTGYAMPDAIEKAFNDPTVDCCGRDAADCDCPPPGSCPRDLNELHAALLRRAGTPSDSARRWLKDQLFVCHYSLGGCGWTPPPLVQHGPQPAKGFRIRKVIGQDRWGVFERDYVWSGFAWKHPEDDFTSTVDGAAGYEDFR